MLMVLIIGMGCGNLEKKGPTPANFSPVIYLANVPIDESSFLANPTVHWYATDKDGFITMYRYAVKTTDEYADPNDFIALSEQNGFEDWIEITVKTGEVSTSGQIRLFASANPDSFVNQFVYVQAMDNFGSLSNVAYRKFNRANHAPNTRSAVGIGPHLTGSCVPSQAQNIGIAIQWEGSDSLDYPGRQPDFEYAWEIYGPFDSYLQYDTISVNDQDVEVVSVVPDTVGIVWEDHLIEQSYDDMTNSKWTFSTFAQLFDLFRNVPSSNETLFGGFVFKVRTRDDAFVEDPTPSISTFQALNPKCERGILVLDLTKYECTPLGGLVGNCPGVEAKIGFNLVEEYYHPYFSGVLEEAIGVTFTDGVDSTNIFYTAPGADVVYLPGPELMARYKLVIVIAEDAHTKTPDEWKDALGFYMDMGGNVMLTGPDHLVPAQEYNFFSGDPLLWNRLVPVSLNSFAYQYFNIEAVYLAAFGFSTELVLFGFVPWTFEEMGVALSLESGELPDMVVDSAHLAEYAVYIPPYATTGGIWNDGPPYPFLHNAVPGVNYFISGGLAQGIYMSSSVPGAVTGGELDGAIVGYRYKEEGFKSSVFGFPLYAMERDALVDFFRGMIAWYEIDL